jgi:phospholipid/cholesterol/gamma-HCH transport system substrate-binding protein
LLPGDIITINGMQVGTITSMKFHPSQDGSIVIEFIMNNEINIPNNSTVKIVKSLMGYGNLNLILGDSKTLAQSGDTLNCVYDAGTLGMITESILPLKNNLETLLVSLNELTTNINGMLNAELKDNINKGASCFASSMNNIETISSDIQQLTDSKDGKLTMMVNNLETITDNFGTLSDSLKTIDYNSLVTSLENCLTEFNTLLNGINNGEGSAGLLVKEDSLYNNINTSIETLQSILEEIKANPKKIKLSVF